MRVGRTVWVVTSGGVKKGEIEGSGGSWLWVKFGSGGEWIEMVTLTPTVFAAESEAVAVFNARYRRVSR